jgi:hypothetical protein
MSYTNEGKNHMLTELAAVATHMRLLNTEATEITDYTAASQDKALSWGTAAGGEISITNQPQFEIPGGTTVGAISFRSSDGLTEYARKTLDVADQEDYANDGTYTVTMATMDLNLVV